MDTKGNPNKDAMIIIEFLAKKEGLSVEKFTDKILAEKEQVEKEQEMFENLKKEIEALPESFRLHLLRQLTAGQTKAESQKASIFSPKKRCTILELKDFHQDELKGTKPSALIINKQRTTVRDWTEATVVFATLLLANGDFSHKDLPLIVRERGEKAYINNTDTQLNGKDALFKKIGKGIYVDTKYNALGHVTNMFNALKKLGLCEKYAIEFEF
jgi:hypothetical protein